MKFTRIYVIYTTSLFNQSIRFYFATLSLIRKNSILRMIKMNKNRLNMVPKMLKWLKCVENLLIR